MSAEPATRLKAESATEAAQLFVINLCASTSPMALTHPNTPELRRFTFFVSRQREDGRERFRLHMGYFSSQEEAELLLTAVRDVYPAAWAGPAPTSGVPRRARISAPPTVTVAPPVAAPASAVPVAAPVPAPVPATVQAPVPAASPARKSPAAEPEALEAMSNVRDVLARLGEETPAASVAAPAATPAREANNQPRAVAAARAVAPATAPELDASQTLSVLESAVPAIQTRAMPAAEAAATPGAVAAASRPAMPAAARAPAKGRAPVPPSGEGEVRIVTPEDTQTLTDIRLDAENNAPPCFAVQLVWAVAPIDVTNLPHLAIFDAYTLYNVEGSRQGRKWFGLRLGFFSDPHSATQVAHYVRSDYPAVAVVPVATRERDHAKGGAAVAAPAAGSPAPLRPENSLAIEKQALDGFELLPDDVPRAAKRDVDDIAAQPAVAAPVPPSSSMTARAKIAAAAAGKPLVKTAAPAASPAAPAAGAAAPAAGKPAGKPAGKRVVVRKRPQPGARSAPGAPNPLESTLEILGASTLTLDESREIVNDSAIRKPIEKKSGSRFSKLLSRLSGG